MLFQMSALGPGSAPAVVLLRLLPARHAQVEVVCGRELCN